MPRTTRIVAFGLLGLSLAAGALQAVPSVPPTPHRVQAEPSDFVKAAWDWFKSIFVPHPEPANDNPSAARSKEGSQLDPDGHD